MRRIVWIGCCVCWAFWAAAVVFWTLEAEAVASELPMKEEGVVLSIGLTSQAVYYTRPLGPFESWVGFSVAWRPGYVALPFGLAYRIFESESGRYMLRSRAQIAPTGVYRDDFGILAVGTLGLDNIWSLDRIGFLLGSEIVRSQALVGPYDHVSRFLVIPGIGLPFGRTNRLWVMLRVGYAVGGVGGGTAVVEPGLGFTRRF